MDNDRVTGVGVARTYYLWQIGHHQDLTWYGYDLFTSSVAEVQLAIICICLPYVRSFFRAYFPELGTTTGARNASAAGMPGSDWIAIGEEREQSYVLNEKGMVVPKGRPSSASEDLGLSPEEQAEVEWARRQVQKSEYIPPRRSSSASSVVINVEGQDFTMQRLRSQEMKISLDTEREEEWQRSKVREWVTKRPVKGDSTEKD